MTLTIRNKRTSYDNIAAGSASGRELLISGDTVSKQEVYGGGYVVSTSNAEMDITNIVNDGVSTSDSEVQGPENMLVGTDPPDERVASSNVENYVS